MNERFVVFPNLPAGSVSRVIVSDRYPALCEGLAEYGIAVTAARRLADISGAEAYHADMSICHIGGNDFYVSPGLDADFYTELESLGAVLHYTSARPTAKKPCLNICLSGESAVCNTCTADPTLLEALKHRRFRFLHTNQGYTKCSAAVVGRDAVITADPSVYRICSDAGMDVLRICAGGIALDGYEYGFIGGTCGKLSRDTLAFCGDIRQHRDYDNIRTFAGNHGVYLLSLCGGQLYDIGGILPVCEMDKNTDEALYNSE